MTVTAAFQSLNEIALAGIAYHEANGHEREFNTVSGELLQHAALQRNFPTRGHRHAQQIVNSGTER